MKWIACLLALSLFGFACSKKDEAKGADPGKDESNTAQPAKTEPATNEPPAKEPVAKPDEATPAADSPNEFKKWADDMCACKEPACLNKQIAGFKPLYSKYNGMKGEAARKIGEAAGREAGRGVNCFVQGGGDKALMEEIANMMR